MGDCLTSGRWSRLPSVCTTSFQLMDSGALPFALCCDKQQMFSNNVYRLGLHLLMTHTCFQSQRPRGTIHPPSFWVDTALQYQPGAKLGD